MDAINENNNNDTLLIKSICIVNIVKIEFDYLKKRSYKAFEKLKCLCDRCNLIVDNLEEMYKEKNLYKEINNINNNIKNIIIKKRGLTQNQENYLIKLKEDMEKEFDSEYAKGPSDLIKKILTKYPYDSYEQENENIYELWDKNNINNNKSLLFNLKNKYNSEINNNEKFEEKVKKEKHLIIIKYLSMLISKINNNIVCDDSNLFDD